MRNDHPHHPHYPPQNRPAKPEGGGPDLLAVGVGIAVVLLALPAALGAIWARRFMKSKQNTIAVLALAGGLVFAAVCLKPFKAHLTASRDTIKAAKATEGLGGVLSATMAALPFLWLSTLPLLPALILVWDSVRPKSLDDQQVLEQEKKAETSQRAVDRARRRISRAVERGLEPKTLAPGVNSAAILAANITGDTLFFARDHKQLLYLNPDTGAASLHLLVVGETGSGKTASLLRIVASIAAVTPWDIFFINPKNDRATMQQFYDLMTCYDRPCRLFPQEAYNGWEGDSGALLSRIMAIPAYATEGAASYYTDLSEVYLRAVLTTGEPLPGSFEELEERLEYRRLADQYKDNVQGFARVASISAADAKNVVMRFAMMTPKLTMIRRDGWTLEATRAAYFGLPVLANERDAQAVAKFLIEDVKHHLAVRKDPTRRAVFVLDEFSALGTESVIRLAEMARSLGGIVMLGTQTLAGLGNADQQARLVGNMAVVLHRMSAPEELTRLAGVQQVIQKAQHFQGRRALKRGTYRLDDADRIPAQDVRTLPTGCAWIIARGAAAKVQMGLPPEVPEVPIIISQQRRTPPPVPTTTVRRTEEEEDTTYGHAAGAPNLGRQPGRDAPAAQTTRDAGREDGHAPSMEDLIDDDDRNSPTERDNEAYSFGTARGDHGA